MWPAISYELHLREESHREYRSRTSVLLQYDLNPSLSFTILTALSQELVRLANALVTARTQRTKKSLGLHVPVVRELPVRMNDLDWCCRLLTLLRLSGSCTCEKAADGGRLPDEIDFTTKA